MNWGIKVLQTFALPLGHGTVYVTFIVYANFCFLSTQKFKEIVKISIEADLVLW